MKNKRKPIIEIMLGIILIVSLIVFAVMLNKSDDAKNNADKGIGYTQYAVEDLEEKDMYKYRLELSREAFEKYQIKRVGERVSYYKSCFSFPGGVIESDKKAVRGKEQVTLINFEISDTFKGIAAESEMKYVVITIMASNSLGKEYVFEDFGFLIGKVDEDYVCDMEYPPIDTEFTAGVIRYELDLSESALELGGIMSEWDGVFTNNGGVLLPKGGKAEYKLAYLIPEEDIRSGDLAWGNLTYIKGKNQGRVSYNNMGFLYKLIK